MSIKWQLIAYKLNIRSLHNCRRIHVRHTLLGVQIAQQTDFILVLPYANERVNGRHHCNALGLR